MTASHTGWVEGGVKRDRMKYLVGTACGVSLNNAKAGVHHGGGEMG